MTRPITLRAAVVLAIANVISGMWLHHMLTQQPPEFLPAGGPCFAVDMRLPGVVYPLGYALHCDPNRPIWELECTAMFGGKAGGLVRPAKGSLFAAKAEAVKACTAGSAKVVRVSALLLSDGSLVYAK